MVVGDSSPLPPSTMEAILSGSSQLFSWSFLQSLTTSILETAGQRTALPAPLPSMPVGELQLHRGSTSMEKMDFEDFEGNYLERAPLRRLASPSTQPVLTEADQGLRVRVHVLLLVTALAAGYGVYVTKYEGWKNMMKNAPSASHSSAGLDDGVDDARRFKMHYLAAYLLAMLGDWLQGPYVYALYAAYGFSHEDNSRLFIFGFGSSMLFGTFIGGYADKYGRKKFAILYCAVYACSCMTKHFNSFFMLSIGRILAGIATSLLYSVFESWVVCEHGNREFPDSVLGDIFSLSIFGNSCVAIGAGFVAQWVSDLYPFTKLSETIYIGQYTNPFDFAAFILAGCGLLIHTFWTENVGGTAIEEREDGGNMIKKSTGDGHGSPSAIGRGSASPANKNAPASGSNRGGRGSGKLEDIELEEEPVVVLSADVGEEIQHQSDFHEAWHILKTNTEVRCLALICGFFESSMFIFVFLWTPAIMQADGGGIKNPPFGLVFALFMLGCMAGSCLFSWLTTPASEGGSASEWETPKLAFLIFVLSALAHGLVVLSSGSFLILSAFVLFEICVGLYFPTMGMLKSKIVPESCRSTMYNFFRVPLNFIVCCVLLSNVPVKLGFTLTTALLSSCVYMLFLMFGAGPLTGGSSTTNAARDIANGSRIDGDGV
ncbi:unnamed protein product [Amoebophrya sp. A25]|nr:unnamed protein product [Amoebophrya sp. A25]|eukprot:GSA25T00019319001.1